MSKVVKHTRIKGFETKKGNKVRTEHNHLTLGKTGYIPKGVGQNPYKMKKFSITTTMKPILKQK